MSSERDLEKELLLLKGEVLRNKLKLQSQKRSKISDDRYAICKQFPIRSFALP